MNYRTNMPARNVNNLSKLMYDTNCEMFTIRPRTICDSNGESCEVEIEKLPQLFYNLLLPYLVKDELKLLSTLVEKFELSVNIEYCVDYMSNSQYTTWAAWNALNYYTPGFINECEVHTLVYKYITDYYLDTPMWNEQGETILQAVGHQWKTQEGRLTKRVGKYFYNRYGIKLTSAELSAFGVQYDNLRNNPKEFYIRLTNNFDWNNGHYGNNSSCWWGDYTTSRDTLHHYGGFGALFYISPEEYYDRDGVGRMWVAPLSDNLVLAFNYYGPEQQRYAAAAIARLLEELTGDTWVYGKRNTSDGGNMYVNGGSAFAIWKKGNDAPPDTVSFGYYEQSDYFSHGVKCERCDNFVDEEYSYYENGYTYCSDCWSELYFYCYYCGEVAYRDEMYNFEDSHDCLCARCYDNNHDYTCDRCGGSFCQSPYLALDDTENQYCERCSDYIEYTCCEHGCYENGCDECKEEEDNTDE